MIRPRRRNADRRRRELERRAATSGPEEQAELLRERVRQGELELERVEIAAALEHPAAVLVAEPHPAEDLRELQVELIDRFGLLPEPARNLLRIAGIKQRAAALGIDVAAVSTIDKVMSASDIVVTTTPSSEPLVQAAGLKPGQHVTAMGSDADHKTELAPDVLAAADFYVCDSYAQCLKQGELRAAVAAGAVAPDLAHLELGAVIASGSPARSTMALPSPVKVWAEVQLK